MGGVFSSVSTVFKTATGSKQKIENFARKTKTSPADVVGIEGRSAFFPSLTGWLLDIVEWVQRRANEC
jgi:hypothetical protein